MLRPPSSCRVAGVLLFILTATVTAQPPKKEIVPKLNPQKILAAEAALTKAGCVFSRERNNKSALVGHVRVVNFGDKVTDETLPKLIPAFKDLPALNGLDAGESKLTDKGIAEFAKLPNLEALYLDHTALTDKGLESLADLKQIYWLDLSHTKITGASLKTISKFTRLEHLTLRGVGGITDDEMAPLAELRGLREIAFPDSQVTQASLKHLTGLETLTRLDLASTTIGDEGAKVLSEFKRLQYLTAHCPFMTDEGLQSLTGCSSLVSMNLNCPKATGENVKFDQMTKLTSLSLYGGASDDGLKAIAKAPVLTNLDIRGGKFSGAALSNLLPLTKLESLSLDNSFADNAGLKSLEKLRFLRTVYAVETKVTQPGANHFMMSVPNSTVWLKYPMGNFTPGIRMPRAPNPIPTGSGK